MSLPLTTAPGSVCLLRLSALGDVSHCLPVIHSLQRAWPETNITWIIGKTEYELVKDLQNIEFVVFDKRQGLRGYLELRSYLRKKRFDVLLHMQMALRASLIAAMINSPIKLGFDRQRARDLQWLFSNEKIDYVADQHVVESFLSFLQKLGVPHLQLDWQVPVPEDAREFAREQLPEQAKILAISPCSSKAYRNWTIEGYAKVADYAVREHNMQVVITGGPSEIERQYANAIRAACSSTLLDLTGQTSIKQLLAVIQASDVLLAPDSGPAHLATCVGTPVIGLYAATNPDRARPYLARDTVVNAYPEAIKHSYRKQVSEVTFGTRVREPGTMALIRIDEVTAMLDRLLCPALAEQPITNG